MLPIDLDQLTYDQLRRYVDAGIGKSRTLDFRRDVIGLREEDKHELAADISSFANSGGGDIVFGMIEYKGQAVDLPGITADEPAGEIQRLEALIRTALDPPLPTFATRWLEAPAGRNGALVCRIPRSFAAPHRVAARSKFYARNHGGKYEMDTAELRAAFLATGTFVENIRRFRTERLDLIEAGEGALPLKPGPLAILHVVAPQSLVARASVLIGDGGAMLLPPGGGTSGANTRHTLEGFTTYRAAVGDPDGVAQAYALLFRSGAIEAAISLKGNTKSGLAASMWEWPILRMFPGYLDGLKRHHAIEPPLFVALSLLGVKGLHLFHGEGSSSGHTFGRDRLLVPEILVERSDESAETMLRPLFDIVWNAFGWSRALTFDSEGRYIGPRW